MWQLYVGQKIYDTQGQIITEEDLHKMFPASIAEQVAINVVGDILVEIKTFLQLCAEYGVDYTAEDAINQINHKVYLQSTESTALERIAAALEYIVLLHMEDKES